MILPAYTRDADGVDTFLRCLLFQYYPDAGDWETYRLKWERYPTLGDLATDALLATWSPVSGRRRLEQVVALLKRVLLEEEFFSREDWHSSEDPAELLLRIPGFNVSAADDFLRDLGRNNSSRSTI